jgi:hypothetical protein
MNDKDRMLWASFPFVKRFGLSARYKRGFTYDEDRMRWAAGEAQRSGKAACPLLLSRDLKKTPDPFVSTHIFSVCVKFPGHDFTDFGD